MADEPKPNDQGNQGTPSDGTQNTPAPELTKEQWEAAYKSPRFKELTQAKQELEKLKQAEKTREEDDLKRKGELQKLLDQKDEELKTVQANFQRTAKVSAITAEAAKRGAIDPEAVTRLIDLDKIELDEHGAPTNAADLVDTLLKEKVYLVGKKPEIGSDTTTSNNTDKPMYKQSELREKISRDVNFYTKNKEDIDAAYAEGRVDMNA